MLRKTLIRIEKVRREIEKAGCVTSSALMERLRIAHSELFYVLHMLRREGRVASASLGRVSLWCASGAAAEEVTAKLAETLKSLLCRRGRFATPKEALQLVAEDKETRRLFTRHITLRPNTATIQVIDVLMRKAFGQPIRSSRGRLYHIHCAEKTPTGISSQG
jgi:hypothetical protein